MTFLFPTILSLFTLATFNNPEFQVSATVVKPELNESVISAEMIRDDTIELTVTARNSGTHEATPTIVSIMFPDELSYVSSHHTEGLLTTDYQRFYGLLRWEIPSLAMNEEQTAYIHFNLPEYDQTRSPDDVEFSAVFSTPNGVAFSRSTELQLASVDTHSFWMKLWNWIVRIIFFWQTRFD